MEGWPPAMEGSCEYIGYITYAMEYGREIWNVRTLYRAGFLTRVSRELSRYRLYLVGAQEVRWEGSGSAPPGE
jgi:hypothetical protein